MSTKQTRNPPPEFHRLAARSNTNQQWVRKHDDSRETEFTSPPFVKTREPTKGTSANSRALFQRDPSHRDIPQGRESGSEDHVAQNQKNAERHAPLQEAETKSPITNLPQELLDSLRISTREEVMEELQEATRQYQSCTDPKEAAARIQRAITGDALGQMEETAELIIASVTERAAEHLALLGYDSNPNTPRPLSSTRIWSSLRTQVHIASQDNPLRRMRNQISRPQTFLNLNPRDKPLRGEEEEDLQR